MAFKDYRDIIRQMEREMQQLSDEAFRGFFDVPGGGAGRFWQPAVDIHETDGQLLVKMELAGARSEDLQVSLSPDDRVLTVSGMRTEGRADREGRQRCHQLEIYFGPFERSVGLPSVPLNRDAITASYRDGFLSVTLPKRQTPPRPQKRVIPISNDHALTTQQAENQTESEDNAHVR
ncbi:MAG: Hsp20/alpha crystallin family protein [Armatimonadota bacterium]|nr:Hsp20/alpha crystallin family protein [Armatimonadota bacterium]